MGGSWDVPNVHCEPKKSKWLSKGNLKKYPIEVTQTATRTQFSQWLFQSLSSPLYFFCSVIFFPLSWLILNLLHYCLYLWGFFFFLQRWRARALSMTTGLVARIWWFPPLWPGLNLWSGIQILLQTVSGWGYLNSVFKVVLGFKLTFRKLRSWHPVPSLHGK